jgi:predicted metal-dependent peptidase
MGPSSASSRERLLSLVSGRRFLERYPFHAAVLARMEVVLDPSVQWMAVSLERGRYFLHVNPESFARSSEYAAGILLHEIHHVVLGHLAHPKFREGIEHEEIMQTCLEMSANDGITEPLPSPIVWEDFARFGVRASQSTMERYEALSPIQRRGAAAKSLRDGGAGNVDDHGPWRDGGTANAGALERTRELVERSLDEAKRDGLAPDARIAGLTPGRLLEALGGERVAPAAGDEIDWRAVLRGFVQRLRAPTRTWSRPNRRFADRVGEVPGRAYRSAGSSRPSVLAVIDTSASMGPEALSAIARELERMAPHARVIVCECDTEVMRVYPFTGRIDAVMGRGGTDLRPPFDPSLLAREGADAVVYFTDGEGPWHPSAPGIPTLWVLTQDVAFACPWGERAKLTLPTAGR